MQLGSCKRQVLGRLMTCDAESGVINCVYQGRNTGQTMIGNKRVRFALKWAHVQTYHRGNSRLSRLQGRGTFSLLQQPPQHTFVQKQVRPELSFGPLPYYLLGWWKRSGSAGACEVVTGVLGGDAGSEKNGE